MIPISSAHDFRLATAVRALGIDCVLAAGTGITFRVVKDVPVQVAAWVYPVKTGRIEIWVNEMVLACVSDIELQALLCHELLHHLCWNQSRRLRKYVRPEGTSDEPADVDVSADRVRDLATNLAFDWAIERLLLRGPLADGVRRLSQRYRLARLGDHGPVPLEVQVLLLTASQAPLDALGRVADAYRFLWTPDIPVPPEVAFQLILPLVTELARDQPAFASLSAIYGGTLIAPDGDFVIRALPYDQVQKGSPHRSPLPEAVSRTLRELTNTSPGDHGWFDDVVVPPTQVSQHQTRVLSHWLARQRADEHKVTKCLQAVAGDLQQDRFEKKPYLSKPTRQELVRFAIGFPSLTWNNRVPSSSRTLATYVDTSGSMSHRRGIVCSVLNGLQEMLPAKIFLFSTSIEECDTRRILSGDWPGGGGTSFDAVVTHALQHRFQHAIVITDGEDSVSVPLQAAIRVRGLLLRAVIFDNRYQRETAPWWDWPHVFHWGPVPDSKHSTAPNSQF